MPLNWDVSKVANHDTVCFFTAAEDEPSRGEKKGESYVHPVTNALIWWTVAVGIGRITKENAAEFTVRVQLCQQLEDAPAKEHIKYEQVCAHIGLATNVSNETRAQFLKKVSRLLDRRVAAYAKVDR